METMERCRAEGKAWEGVVVSNRKGGLEPIPVEIKILPVFDGEADNVPSHYVTSRRETNSSSCKNCMNNKVGFIKIKMLIRDRYFLLSRINMTLNNYKQRETNRPTSQGK